MSDSVAGHFPSTAPDWSSVKERPSSCLSQRNTPNVVVDADPQATLPPGRHRFSLVVVDDSALVRGLLTEIINRQPGMSCVGAAPGPRK